MRTELQELLQNPAFREMADNLSEYIYITDEDGYMRYVNPAAAKFEQIEIDSIIGRHIRDIYTQQESPTLKALQTKKPIDEHENIYMLNGKRYSELAKSVPLFSGEKLIGACTIQRDMTLITDVLSDNAALQKSRQANPKSKKRTFDTLVGNHPNFRRALDLAKLSAQNSSPVLLSGPTGSGKEVFAQSIHNASPRKDKPFLAINCAAVPDGLLESILFGTTKGTFTGSLDKIGLFEQAEGGSLFLDEINSMSLNSQAKLLRVLEEKEIRRLGGSSDIKIDVRILSSINTTPNTSLKEGQLRADLFYRLSVTTILIPPLQGRSNDIDLLADHFIRKFNTRQGKTLDKLSPEAKDFFTAYAWPGNVRQLKHVIESAVNSAPQGQHDITMNDLPHYLFEGTMSESTPKHIETFNHDSTVSPGASVEQTRSNEAATPEQVLRSEELQPEKLYDAIRQNEKKEIMDALLQCGGNVSKAARQLNMNRQNLVYRMKKYNITR